MVKIFYGNGECEIQGTDIMYCELRVKYPIEIDDKSPSGFMIKAKYNRIIIVVSPSWNKNDSAQLKKMFNYVGDLHIVGAGTINMNGDKERPVVKKVMDYTELLTTKSEDMTTLSEDLKSKHIYGKKVKQMKLMQPYLENLIINGSNYYLEDGSNYKGFFHISHETGRHFTGKTHDENSLPIYFKDIFKDDVKDELILHGNDNYRKTREWKARGRKNRKKRNI